MLFKSEMLNLLAIFLITRSEGIPAPQVKTTQGRMKLRRGSSAEPPSWWRKPDRSLKLGDRKRYFNVRKMVGGGFPTTCASRVDFGLPRCCDGQDANCYTAGGCFCDIACHMFFGDCCPDHKGQCYDELKLCLFEKQEKQETRVTLRRNFPNPDHLKPNACCGSRAYNIAQKTCCSGNLVNESEANCV